MNISQYIASKENLKSLHFGTVYQTITTLISDGKLSMSDFKPLAVTDNDRKAKQVCFV